MMLLKEVQNGNLEYVKANIDSDTWFKNTPWSDYILLNTSIQHNCWKVTKFLLEKDCRVNCSDESFSDSTPLHHAIAKKNTHLIKILLSKGALVDAKDANDETPIHLAGKSRRREIVNALMPYVKTGKKTNFFNRDGLSHMHVACMSNNLSLVRNFLKKGVNVKSPVNANSPLWPGFTPLHLAVYHNRTAIAELLLNRGANLSATDTRGVTPLHLAFRKKNGTLVKLMLENHNAGSVNLVDDMKISYFHIACSLNNSVILDKYFTQQVDIDGCISSAFSYLSGYSPLHVAVLFKCNDTVAWLLKHRADITKCNSDGFTPLHLAFWRKEYDIIDLFMAAIAEYDLYENSIDVRGVNFLHIACLRDNPGIIQRFIDRGLDINEPIKKSSERLATCTPLHIAVKFENPGNVDVLLSNKADVHAVDIKGKTPLHYICQGTDEKLGTLMTVIKKMHTGTRDINILQAYLNKSVQILSLLIAHKVNVNVKDKSNKIPLFYLFSHGYDVALINRLCEIIPIRERTYRNQVLETIVENRNELIKMIASLKPDFQLKDRKNFSLLHHLAIRMWPEFAKGQEEIAQLMIENGADVNATNDAGETPLYLAVCIGNEKLVDVLLVYGAKVNFYVQSRSLGTPLAAAVNYLLRCSSSHKPRIVSKLITYGADVNARLANGRTVLHNVFGSGKFADVREFKFLCVSDCDLNVPELVTGQTALHLATLVGDVDAIDWLLYCGAKHDLKDYRGFDPVYYCALNPEKTGHVYYNHFQRLRLIGYKFNHTLESNLAAIKNACKQKYLLTDKEYFDELEGLKNFMINQYTSLYNLLFQSPQEMAKYVNNKKLHHLLSESKFCFNFPLYGSLIAIKYRKSIVRHSLLKPSMTSINILTAYILPEHVIEKILGFLSDTDVKNLMLSTKIEILSD